MRHLNNAILNMKVGLVIFRLDVMEAIIELQHHYNGIYKYYFNDSIKDEYAKLTCCFMDG